MFLSSRDTCPLISKIVLSVGPFKKFLRASAAAAELPFLALVSENISSALSSAIRSLSEPCAGSVKRGKQTSKQTCVCAMGSIFSTTTNTQGGAIEAEHIEDSLVLGREVASSSMALCR